MERGLHAEKAVTVQKVSQNVACSAGAGFNQVASVWAGPGAARHGARQVCSPCTGKSRTAGVTKGLHCPARDHCGSDRRSRTAVTAASALLCRSVPDAQLVGRSPGR